MPYIWTRTSISRQRIGIRCISISNKIDLSFVIDLREDQIDLCCGGDVVDQKRKMEEPRIYRQDPPSVAVRWNEPPCAIGWAGKIAVAVNITDEMLPIKRLVLSLTGRDQGESLAL
jgi:hypothetical protein